MNEEPRGKWWWLKSNSFFDQTPLTGFSFIPLSKTRIEVVFWYLLICTFLGFTVYNVHGVVQRYRAKPTQTAVLPMTSTSELNLTNITIKLNLSMFHFYNKPLIKMFNVLQGHKPKYDDYKVAGWYGMTHLYICEMIKEQNWEPILSFDVTSVFDKFFQHLYKSLLVLNSNEQNVNGIDFDTSQNETSSLEGWYEMIRENQKTLLTHLFSFDFMPAPSYKDLVETVSKDEKIQIKEQFKTAFMGPLKSKMMGFDTTIKLQLLSLLENSNHFRNILAMGPLYDIMFQIAYNYRLKNATNEGDLLHFMNKIEQQIEQDMEFIRNITGKQLLELLNVSASDLYVSTMDDLSQMLLISFGNQSASSHHLISLDSQFKGSFLESQSTPFSIIQQYIQELEYLVVIPPGTKDLNLEITSFPYLWFNYIIGAVASLPGPSADGCLDSEAKSQAKFKQALNDIRSEIMQLYKQHVSLDIETHRGNGLHALEPFRHYDIIAKPTGAFYSHTDNCYKSSYQYCLSSCLNEASKAQCHCYPWSMAHLNQDSELPVCDSKCQLPEEQRSKCGLNCENAVQRSCHLATYQIEQVNHPFAIPLPENVKDNMRAPLYTLRLSKVDSLNFPSFIENYQLTFGLLMAEMGGLLELWLGINVIGVIHLILYVFKQCVHGGTVGHQVRSTLRAICGKESAVEPMSQEVKAETAEQMQEVKIKSMLEEHSKRYEELNVQMRVDMRKTVEEIESKFMAEIRKLREEIGVMKKAMEEIQNKGS